MSSHVPSPPSSPDVTIHLPPELQHQVQQVAQQQDKTVSEIITLLLERYIPLYLPQRETKEDHLPEARKLMREFGEGIGQGSAPHDAARNHDNYLYS